MAISTLLKISKEELLIKIIPQSDQEVEALETRI